MNTPMFDPAQFLASLYKGGEAKARAAEADAAATQGADPAAGITAFMMQMGQLQQQFMQQMTDYWSAAAGVAPVAGASGAADKRFAADAWRTDPRFDAVHRTYLAYSQYLQDSVEAVPLDEKTKAQMRFGMRQFVDAISPSNFFVTNPEAMQLAVETGGQSVTQGMQLFLDDMAKGRVSTTDEGAYELGRNVATMPGDVVYENALIQVIQYAPATADVHAIPILLVPPCINKFYIMDLQPDNSLVRYLREQGHTVFMLSWRNVGAEQGDRTWDDYLEQGVMQAVDVALGVTGAEQTNALGFCVGGTLLASALAVMKARDEHKVASLTLLTSMLDFSDTGEIGALVTEQSVAAREQSIGGGGIMKGKELSFAFTALRANDLMWQYVTNSYLKGKSPPAFDMLHWNADNTNLPGPMFCWYVRNCYLENNLRIPGKTTQCGEPVDLTLIDVPAFLYASREDHIVPWRTAYLSNELLAGDTTFVLGASGHIAGVINPPAKNKRNYWLGGEPGPDADRWFDTARNVPGSWWPEWGRWLAGHAGPRVAARKSLGSRKFKRIEKAPGRYVAEKA